ncbi:hypothetical protein WJT74_03575 [Sphingomicrobium sp. XHP0239]
MQTVFKIIVAVLAVVIAWSILKNALGLLIGLALAALLYIGATRLLEKK